MINSKMKRDNIQKKPMVEKCNDITNYKCPVCGKRLFSTKDGRAMGRIENYCGKCGQALTWKGIKIETYWIYL